MTKKTLADQLRRRFKARVERDEEFRALVAPFGGDPDALAANICVSAAATEGSCGRVMNQTTEMADMKMRATRNIQMERPDGFNEAALSPAFDWGMPLRWRRTPAGLKTNVRWTVRHHSPDGFEIGDPGPGPADLALNMLAVLFPYEDENFEQCFDGKVSRQAWKLHQDFKFEFLTTVDRNEGEVEWDLIETWLLERGVEVD